MYLPISVKWLYHTLCYFALSCIRASEGLTWHGVIPTHEISLKIGGDKGRGSFKLNIQLCNVPHPNSQKNTYLLSMFMAGDSTTNLHNALDMYKEMITEIQGMNLR